MDGLELNVCQPNANERRQAILRVKIFLEVCQECCQLLRRWGNENGVAGTRPTNPVLTAADFSRLLISTADSAHELVVRVVQQSYGERKPASVLDLSSRKLYCIQVVADFIDVISAIRVVCSASYSKRSIRVA